MSRMQNTPPILGRSHLRSNGGADTRKGRLKEKRTPRDIQVAQNAARAVARRARQTALIAAGAIPKPERKPRKPRRILTDDGRVAKAQGGNQNRTLVDGMWVHNADR